MASASPSAPPGPDPGSFPGPYPAPFERDPSRWRRSVTPAHVDALRREGWCVVDNFLAGGGASAGGDGGAWASALREEIKWLATTGLMRPNRTHFANPKGERYLFSKPNVFETDLHESDVRARLPELDALFAASADGLADAFTAASSSLPAPHPASADEPSSSSSSSYALPRLIPGDAARTIKLQHNRGGGGCFPLHYDNPGPPSRRALTCILYLNPDWTEGDGGELLLTPFLGGTIRVRPTHDRLAIFLSDRILHRVLPAKAERFCLTVWLDGEGINAPEDVGLRLPASAVANPAAAAAALRVSPSQRALSRAVYPDEYELSLMECMAGAEGCSQMVASHEAHLRAVASNAPLARFVDALREVRRDGPDAEPTKTV